MALETEMQCRLTRDRLAWLRDVISQQDSLRLVKVANVLVDFVNQTTGNCYPSRKVIAERSGIRPEEVSRVLGNLQHLGLIRANGKVGRYKNWLLIRKIKVSPVTPLDDQQGCHQRHPKGVTSDTPLLIQDSEPKLLNLRQSPTDTGEQAELGLVQEDALTAAKKFLDSDFKPSDDGRVLAQQLGMTEQILTDEIQRFRNHHHQRRTSSNDWQAMWLGWCRQWSKHAAETGTKPKQNTVRMDHSAMTFPNFVKKIGYPGAIEHVAVQCDPENPRALWAKFIDSRIKKPNITAGSWPIIFQQFAKKKN